MINRKDRPYIFLFWQEMMLQNLTFALTSKIIIHGCALAKAHCHNCDVFINVIAVTLTMINI